MGRDRDRGGYCSSVGGWPEGLTYVTYLVLDVGDLGPGELELVEWHLGVLQEPQEAELLGSQDQECVAAAAHAARCPAHPVDVLL